MPRPIRIQYEKACYHVMTRGRGRQVIFHNKDYYQAFLQTLGEAHKRFDAIVHAYCLMNNYYHLIIETPRANLDRIMRHVNGLYTQRYNRLRKTDGPLFRGRYKAVLVDKDANLLRLSRYIHRSPIEAKGASSNVMDTYQWSSYLAYINVVKPEPWLERDTVYNMLGQRNKYIGYKTYIAAGVDEEMRRFYGKGNIAAILGDATFKASIAKNKEQIKISGELSQALSTQHTPASIIKAVAQVFKITQSSITHRKSGRQNANLPRKFAMYCCQQLGDMPLKTIAAMFELKHEGSVSPAVNHIQQCLTKGELIEQLNTVKALLNIVKQD
tara:strand:+ start:414 stop:1394 length:981 start_codon:yes stop_codon:yes gene_type:complete